MQRIFNMAVKDLKILSRDRMGAFFIIGFPILMGVFFGLVMGGNSSGGGRSKMNVALVDRDQSAMSQKFVDALMASDFRRIFIVEDGKLVGLISRADLMPAVLDALLDRC